MNHPDTGPRRDRLLYNNIVRTRNHSDSSVAAAATNTLKARGFGH